MWDVMLSIGKIASGPKAAKYYTEQVARGVDDYYAGEGEEPGRWTGSATVSAGVSGEVDDERFAQLLAGAGLRRPPREGAVAGFDLTFRAPKSVDLLWAIGPPQVVREVRACHDVAVAQALGYLEREACRARRGAGGVLQVPGGGFLGAAFTHRASRAGDPLLHTHVVVGNLTQGPDGRWTALDARHLYRHAKTAGYLYQAVLRRELTERLGVQWHAVEHGVADVVGVPREVIEHFSQRRAEIREHLVEHGGQSARAAQVAALATRRAKQDVPVDRLREVWRARAAEHGLDARAVAAITAARERAAVAVAPLDPERLTEAASTFGRAELLQHLAEAQPHGADVASLERLADRVLAQPGVVRLVNGATPAGLTEPRFTTREMLTVERELIDGALARAYAGVGRATPRAISAAIEGSALSDEQRRVVRELCGGRAGMAVLRAPAGTGKTFVLDAAREAWEQSGATVLGCALSARAALELQDQAGIRALTIAKLRQSLKHGEQLPFNGVLVVDEAARAYRDRGRITIGRRASEARDALVNDWARAEGDSLMIAARREDVRDLNDRARHLLREKGELGPDELRAAGRDFAVGDRVVGLRNDRRRGILNGQRATVTGIDTERRCLEIEHDGGKRITLDAGYLEAGHLDHGYAITAHRAQGATVDRTFVLGSDELYREWGYTALSRHREEARFYVTRADLDLDRDAAPEPDPAIRGIERLLSRSKAKDLALDGLPDADRRLLDSEADVLRQQFHDHPPPLAPELERDLRHAEADVAAASERRALLERGRDGLRWHRRRERTDLTRLLDHNAVELEQRIGRYEHALHAHTTAVEARQHWLEAHGPDAQRLLAIDQELRQRDRLDHQTLQRLDQFHREPSPLDRGLDAPVHDRGLGVGRDIGIDL